MYVCMYIYIYIYVSCIIYISIDWQLAVVCLLLPLTMTNKSIAGIYQSPSPIAMIVPDSYSHYLASRSHAVRV